MLSNITVDPIFKGKVTVTRKEVYEAVKNKGINLYAFDTKLLDLETNKRFGKVLLIFNATILGLVALCAPPGTGIGIGTCMVTVGALAGLTIIVVASVKKRGYLKKSLTRDEVNQIFNNFKEKIAQERHVLSTRIYKMLAQDRELDALNNRIRPDAELKTNS
jgi:hypothetical protein